MTKHVFGLGHFGGGTGKYPPYQRGEPTETVIGTKIRTAIKERYPDAFIRKIHSGGYMAAGVPDLYVAINGHGIWIEIKRPMADTTATQQKTLEAMWAQGIPCGTADSVQTALDMIKEVVGV